MRSSDKELTDFTSIQAKKYFEMHRKFYFKIVALIFKHVTTSLCQTQNSFLEKLIWIFQGYILKNCIRMDLQNSASFVLVCFVCYITRILNVKIPLLELWHVSALIHRFLTEALLGFSIDEFQTFLILEYYLSGNI